MSFPKGAHHSEEALMKMRAARAGKRPALGMSHTAETKAKIGAATSGHQVSAETRQKLSDAQVGRPALTAEARAKMSAAKKGKVPVIATAAAAKANFGRSRQHKPDCLCAVHGGRLPRGYSSLPSRLAALIFQDVRVEFEKPFYPYRVDIYLPDYHLAVEADGSFWHRGREERDHIRDERLLSIYGLPVARFSQDEILAMEADRDDYVDTEEAS